MPAMAKIAATICGEKEHQWMTDGRHAAHSLVIKTLSPLPLCGDAAGAHGLRFVIQCRNHKRTRTRFLKLQLICRFLFYPQQAACLQLTFCHAQTGLLYGKSALRFTVQVFPTQGGQILQCWVWLFDTDFHYIAIMFTMEIPPLIPAAPTYHSRSSPLRLSRQRDDATSSVSSCSQSVLMNQNEITHACLCTGTVHARVFGRGGAMGTWRSPTEWISSALRRCQEDKWAACFCLVKASGYCCQNSSFCIAGCLSITAIPFISVNTSLLAGSATMRDVSAQF